MAAPSPAFSQRDSGESNLDKRQAKTSVPVSEGYFTGADGVRLFYRKVGRGKNVVVFLHGGPGGSINDGGYDMEPLAKNRTLIMYDQRGGGRSELITDPSLLTASYHLRDLEALRQHFGIERMTIIGLSWGAGLATLYASRHPERVERMLLVSPMAPTRTFNLKRWENISALIGKDGLARLAEIRRQMAKASDKEVVALCRERFSIMGRPYFFNPAAAGRERGDLCSDPPAAIRNNYLLFDATMASMVTLLGEDRDFRPLLAKLRMPVLVVEGGKTNVPLDATRVWAVSLSNGRLLLIPNAGHFNYLDRPDIFFPAAEHFLRGKFPKGAQVIHAATANKSLQRTP